MIEIPLMDINKSIQEEKEPSKPSKLNYRYTPSLLESLYFGWIFPLLSYARKHTLSLDVLQNLSKEEKSETVYYRWNDYWTDQKSRNSEDPLFQSIKLTFKREFILGFIFCFLSYTSTMAVPILLYNLGQYLQSEQKSAGWDVLYIIMIPFVRFTRSLFNGHSIFRLETIGTQIANSLTIGMVNKAMKYSVLCNKSFKLGEISGLMNVDCFRLAMFPRSLTELIIFCYCLLFGIVFLAILLSYSFLAGLGVAIIVLIVNIQTSKKTRECLKQFSKATDQRMKVTNEVFNNIKFIKVNAYEETFYDRLMQKREAEINCLKNKRKYDAILTFVMWWTPKIILSITFILFVYTGHPLKPQITFSIFSLFNYLQFYLQNLPNAINNTMESFNSLNRVQKFLLAQEINTSCITYNNLNIPSKDDNNSITMDNGNFYWDKQNQANDGVNPIMNLIDLNFNIKQGQMVAIIGGVGAGKSSLLYSLLGQMKFKESQRPRVTVNGSMSLVTQKPWIINDTVRNNITFGQRFEDAKYKETIKYACLERDFELFTHGDQTMIGEKGATLSGGQKARISFARALYSNSDILLLDDLLSAVDVHVGKFMMTESLLKFTKKKTRILVTHALYYLKYCDKVLMMEGGRIVEQGSFDVIKASSRFQEMQDAMMKDDKKKRATTIKLPPIVITQNNQVDEEEERQYQILRQANNVSQKVEKNLSAIDRSKLETIIERKTKMSMMRKMKIQVKEIKQQGKQSQEVIEVKVQEKKPEANQNELMVAEEVSNTSVFKLYSSFVKYNLGWLYFLVIVINQIIWMVCNTINNIWLTYWTAFYVQTNPNFSQDFWSLGYLLTGALYALLAMFRNLLISNSTPRMSLYIHESMISNLLFSSLNEFFDRVPLGRILNRLSKDLNSVDMNVPLFANNSIAFVFFLGSNSITMNIEGTYYIFIPLLIVFFALNHVLRMYYSKPAAELSKLESITKSPIVSCFSEILSGISSIRSYKKQSMFMMKNCAKIDENKKPMKDKKALDIWFILRMTVISFITTFSAIIYALFWPVDGDSEQAIYQKASSSILLMVQAAGLDQFTYYFINNLGSLDIELQSIERCETFMNLQPEEGYVEYLKDRQVNKVKAIQKRLNSDGWPDKGRIDFVNLKCRYRKNLDLVLKGLNFTITGGHKLGVVGRTGSGKSTIMLCLLRILQAAEGQILIDGRDIGKMSLEELRSKITIILQDPCLFAGTVRQNLDPLNQFSDQHLNNALDLCGLKETLSSKNGLDTAVTENGENFSAGERQLFSICRATLKPSKIVLIDEATANIDVQTEAIIYKAMNEGFKHSTVITVAHRLNTVINSDRILVLEGGLLKQYDNPQQLLKNPDSFFAQLYNQSLKENKM